MNCQKVYFLTIHPTQLFYHNNVEVESIFGDHGKGTYKHYFSTQSKNGANGGIVSTDKVYFYSYD